MSRQTELVDLVKAIVDLISESRFFQFLIFIFRSSDNRRSRSKNIDWKDCFQEARKSTAEFNLRGEEFFHRHEHRTHQWDRCRGLGLAVHPRLCRLQVSNQRGWGQEATRGWKSSAKLLFDWFRISTFWRRWNKTSQEILERWFPSFKRQPSIQTQRALFPWKLAEQERKEKGCEGVVRVVLATVDARMCFSSKCLVEIYFFGFWTNYIIHLFYLPSLAFEYQFVFEELFEKIKFV